jgi:hypothetical protein
MIIRQSFCPAARAGAVLALVVSAGCATMTPLAAALPSAPPVTTVGPRDPSCVGDCLAGKDPFATGGSAGARTMKRAHVVTEGGDVIGLVELRYSPLCNTTWARILRTDEKLDGAIVGGISVDRGSTWLSHRAEHAMALWTDMQPISPGSCAAASAVIYDGGGARLNDDDVRASDCMEPGASLAAK